ncbi:MAG: hypothetical protein HY048_17865 [Acidobacteria bacterium]|nr:hypothetical protein [Acidobacteriota bacterium]
MTLLDPGPDGVLRGNSLRALQDVSTTIDSQRQDNITIIVRVEKVLHLAAARTVSAFADGYNLFNTNAATNINWSSGSTFLTPSTIVPPRIARVGVKFDW